MKEELVQIQNFSRTFRARGRLVAKNKARRYLVVANLGPAETVIMSFRRAAGGDSVVMPPGASFAFSPDAPMYLGEIWVRPKNRRRAVTIHFLEFEPRKGERLPV